MRPRRRPAGRIPIAVALAALLALGAFAGALAAPGVVRAEEPAVVRYDDGPILVELPDPDADGVARAQVIGFFTDCSEGHGGDSCGAPHGRWADDDLPVRFCSAHAGRPSTVTADAFRAAIRFAADTWNATSLAVGVRYAGDCDTASWSFGNGVNEIGFDDARDVIRGTVAGVARGTWRNLPSHFLVLSREYVEFDVVLDNHLDVSNACLRAVVAHEIGHTLGLGHSDDPRDLMYTTFSPGQPTSCTGIVTETERAALSVLYAPNAAPSASLIAPATAAATGTVVLRAAAQDADGDPLEYAWTQVSGVPVEIDANGAEATFVVPATAAGDLRFRVEVSDRYGHRSSAEAVVAIDTVMRNLEARSAPGFASFLPASGSARLAWEPVVSATSYRFCAAASCADRPTAGATIDWDTVLGAAGDPSRRLVLTTGTRATSLAACNPLGCTGAGEGPLAGGLRWAAWAMDYDYLAMAYDVPQVGMRFTIGGVVNVTGESRKFTIYSGTATDPLRTRVHGCGLMQPGQLCIGLLMPGQPGHDPYLTIVSEARDTPTVEHRIRVR